MRRLKRKVLRFVLLLFCLVLARYWDKANLDHVEGDNCIPRQDVEDVCFGEHIVDKQETEVFRLFGKAESGRLLSIIIKRIQGTTFRPITAYGMNETQKRAYKKRTKGKK